MHISYFNLTYVLGAYVVALWFDAEAEELLALSFSFFGACCEEEFDLCSDEVGVDRRASFSYLVKDFSVLCAAGTHFLAGFIFFFRC